MTGKLIQFPHFDRRMTPEEARKAVESALSVPLAQRAARAQELRLEDPELLVYLCEHLTGLIEIAPANVREEAEFLYGFLQTPKRRIGHFDERDYLLGELALIAGTASRFLFRREDARRWFERAEASFLFVANAAAHSARLAYQRLALRLEEREYDEVLELAPVWKENFERLELPEEALKCELLAAVTLKEAGRLSEAVERFREICTRAEGLRNVRMIAVAATNLSHYYRALGEPAEALRYARKSLPLLQQLGNRVGLVKLRWNVGDILRQEKKFAEAIAAYREALEEASEVGMRGDQAALHLVLADVLLDADQDRQAEWEIRAAIPIIMEEKMVPEGYAALTLLQESLRRRKIDRQALRELHGFFQER